MIKQLKFVWIRFNAIKSVDISTPKVQENKIKKIKNKVDTSFKKLEEK